MNPRITLSRCLVAVAVVSCAGTTPPAVSGQLSSAEVVGEHKVPWPDLGMDADRYITIQLGPDHLERCRKVSPKFPFDSSMIQVQDRPELDAIASCLNHATMEDQSIVLIGRADPRGKPEYNETLGMKRALKIKDALVASGVSEGRIKVESRGASGAMGDKPDFAYGYDRRVDIVVQGVHAPR